MGGHAAWRKRVQNGELAKQAGGAICRHRPRLGRRGKDIEKNKKGNILGGPNKKKKNKGKFNQVATTIRNDSDEKIDSGENILGFEERDKRIQHYVKTFSLTLTAFSILFFCILKIFHKVK